jgi:hypothetical protein
MANSDALKRAKGIGVNLQGIMGGDLEWTSAHDCSARGSPRQQTLQDRLQPAHQRHKGA